MIGINLVGKSWNFNILYDIVWECWMHIARVSSGWRRPGKLSPGGVIPFTRITSHLLQIHQQENNSIKRERVNMSSRQKMANKLWLIKKMTNWANGDASFSSFSWLFHVVITTDKCWIVRLMKERDVFTFHRWSWKIFGLFCFSRLTLSWGLIFLCSSSKIVRTETTRPQPVWAFPKREICWIFLKYKKNGTK